VPPVPGHRAAGRACWQVGRQVWALLLLGAVEWAPAGGVWGGWLRAYLHVWVGVLLLLLAPLAPYSAPLSLAQFLPLLAPLRSVPRVPAPLRSAQSPPAPAPLRFARLLPVLASQRCAVCRPQCAPHVAMSRYPAHLPA
jgi:hypothetical protein